MFRPSSFLITFLLMRHTFTTLLLIPIFCCGVCQPTILGGTTEVSEIKLPAGFHIADFATRVKTVRAMAWSPKGIVYAGSMDEGAVYAMPDRNADGVADTVIVVATGLQMPVGVAWHNGDLFVSAVNRIVVLRNIDEHLLDPPAPEVVTDKFPTATHHGWKFIAYGPEGRLYVPVGAPCNICLSADSIYASIASIKPDGTDLRIEAHGVRNSVGFDWDPRDSTLWFTENGRDMMGNDMPSCELNHLSHRGEHFGYPFCHQGDTLDPEFGKGRSCSEFKVPAAKLGPHVAPLGMRFYRGSMFPERYRGAMFIAEHGSWNRSTPIGYRVAVAFPQPDGSALHEIFAEGWLKGTAAGGRPVDVLELPDGSLLVSDDAADKVYRITYTKPATP